MLLSCAPGEAYKRGMIALATHKSDKTTLVLHAQCDEDIAQAGDILRRGGLLAVPTETVYGLAADASNAEAVKAIFTAKGRPADHPLIVHIASVDALARWAVNIPPLAYELAAAFWPGPLTLLLPRAASVPDVVTAGRASIGLRMPAHPVLLRLLQETGMGVAAPSANPYKRLSPTSAAQVLAGLNGRIDAVLDGGDCQVGLESTILDMTGEELRILRSGPVTAAQIAEVAGREVQTPLQHDVAVPGNVAVHYQPRTPLFVAEREQVLAARHARGERVAVVLLGDTAGLPESASVVCMPAQKPAYAQALYRTLHELDTLALEAIWLERPPRADGWADVHDRLNRAASPL